MSEHISYRQALVGVVDEGDIEGLVNLVEQHKNWGAFSCKVPSYVVTRLVDAVRELRQHGADYYDTKAD